MTHHCRSLFWSCYMLCAPHMYTQVSPHSGQGGRLHSVQTTGSSRHGEMLSSQTHLCKITYVQGYLTERMFVYYIVIKGCHEWW